MLCKYAVTILKDYFTSKSFKRLNTKKMNSAQATHRIMFFTRDKAGNIVFSYFFSCKRTKINSKGYFKVVLLEVTDMD